MYANSQSRLCNAVAGATIAAKFGAVASLMRSAGPFSINSPHTGGMAYLQDMIPEIDPSMADLYEPLAQILPYDRNALSLRGVPKIPHGALSVVRHTPTSALPHAKPRAPLSLPIRTR